MRGRQARRNNGGWSGKWEQRKSGMGWKMPGGEHMWYESGWKEKGTRTGAGVGKGNVGKEKYTTGERNMWMGRWRRRKKGRVRIGSEKKMAWMREPCGGG
ncbi:hypothetical protein Pcinc_004088 [Petrolisthes cinctipes]|uniref:Uncharacterized protein n=1 Tax=Petrolisthes cinctipes TaxID=88211 RepID=A0AAE1GHR4_PETCI|nr:hypothetical protein Pcinc_004088 [Petrolisthes cinctipes]